MSESTFSHIAAHYFIESLFLCDLLYKYQRKSEQGYHKERTLHLFLSQDIDIQIGFI